MGFANMFKEKKTIGELQEEKERLETENEYLDTQLTHEEKKAALAKMRANGLNFKSFGSWKAAWEWFKKH